MSGNFKYSNRASSSNFTNNAGAQSNSKSGDSPHTPIIRAGETNKGFHFDDKMTTLMNYRKAKGLCYKCGMKRNPSHKCANSMSLHVVEEIWQMVYGEDLAEDGQVDTKEDSGDDLMALSVNATQGTIAGQIVRLIGDLCGREAIILVDSGSSNNFISLSLASKWRQWSTLPAPVHVRVSNGEILWCTHELVDCPV